MPDYFVAKIADFPEGERRVVTCGDVEIGVFNIGGQYYGWHNSCAHLGGPVCQGRIMKRVIEPVDAEKRTRALDYDETSLLIACPWHGYEFDLRTGHHSGSSRFRLKKANVRLRDGEVYVSL